MSLTNMGSLLIFACYPKSTPRQNFKPRSLSNVDSSSGLNPNFVTGFSDGESSFIISISKANDYKSGRRVRAIFKIVLP